jgi:hypothetical protein
MFFRTRHSRVCEAQYLHRTSPCHTLHNARVWLEFKLMKFMSPLAFPPYTDHIGSSVTLQMRSFRLNCPLLRTQALAIPIAHLLIQQGWTTQSYRAPITSALPYSYIRLSYGSTDSYGWSVTSVFKLHTPKRGPFQAVRFSPHHVPYIIWFVLTPVDFDFSHTHTRDELGLLTTTKKTVTHFVLILAYCTHTRRTLTTKSSDVPRLRPELSIDNFLALARYCLQDPRRSALRKKEQCAAITPVLVIVVCIQQ